MVLTVNWLWFFVPEREDDSACSVSRRGPKLDRGGIGHDSL